jgi:PKD repeat protein
MLIGVTFLISCNPDEGSGGKAVASFQFEVDEADFLTVHFTNFSKNADSYSWDFGDSNTSTEAEPSHTYAAAGTYTVTLTATGGSNEASKSETVIITDPNEALTLLAGSTSKTWKLYRVGAAMSLGPDAANAGQWWPGFTNNGTRPCLYEQSITFERDGGYVFDDAGVFWAEYGVFNGPTGCDSNTIPESCFDVSSGSLVNECGTDVSDWLSGTHSYTYNASTGNLTLTGSGAWIGIPKLGTTGEVLVPQTEVQTKITITEEDGFDLMKVEFIYSGAYWVIYYASYSTAVEPAIVSLNAAFSATSNGLTATFVNQSSGESSWSWNFGDGGTSTLENPEHTYAAAGTYTVTLTISDGNGGTAMASKDVTVSAAALTTKAPTPTAAPGDVISIYSNAYTNITGVNTNPNWGQATVVTTQQVEGDDVLKLTGLNYQGIDFADNLQNVSGTNTVHLDIWSATDATVNFSLISLNPTLESPVALSITGGQWNSFDILLSEWPTVDLTKIGQLKFDAADSPTIYVDNIYFVNVPQ